MRDPVFDRRVELATIALSGVWSLSTLLSFASGNAKLGYTLLAIGTVTATSVALVRTAAEPLPELKLAEEVHAPRT